MSAKIKVTRPTLARRKGGRPAGNKTEMGAIETDVRAAYLRLCEKYGWKKPRKWEPRKVGASNNDQMAVK